MPSVSLCQLSFPDTSWAQDLEMARQLSVPGISIAEAKADQIEDRAGTYDSDIDIPFGVPSTWTILPPLGGTFPADPADPEERIGQIAVSIENLSRLGAPSVMICTGPAGDRSETDARRIVVDALRTLAAVARASGTSLSIEPMREEFRPIRTLVSSLSETLDLLEEVGDDSVGIVFDIWHMWDSHGLSRHIGAATPRFHAVQVADYRHPTRGPLDRVAAGEGVADVPGVLALLRSHGFAGWYDLEVFSDDGRYGSAYEDSLWKLEPLQLARRQLSGFRKCWDLSENR